MNQVNRNYKSSMFTHLFGEPDKEYELYNAIAPGRFPPGTPVKDVTLKDVFFMDRVNDLSFRVGDKLVIFIEHQSSINENMPLRDLIYCGRIYEMIVATDVLYSRKRTTIPTPEFYVLYNGEDLFPEKATYRLSELYALPPAGEPALELVVHVYNVNKGNNEDLVKRSETLDGYVTFVSMARRNEKDGMSRATAIKEAIKECIEHGILAEYLKKYGSEVYNMLMHEWIWVDAKTVWENEAEERADSRWQSVVKDKDSKWQSIVRDKDARWQSVVEDKDAIIAELRARLDKN